ncbi:hypothetical protein N7471_008577 [Penicillium samsonianum]|uniref:uncharacterized protein n=1 Tax=Penicillium samsonianum TaxID=1882272 RepID=UPI002549903F|nr:uncharacterized protein N7471_008577 [Penicillium samsonianum]KAJ6133362.1 hypothetical protein N7471_008577 [Penicillium samsonianum]
MSGVEAIAVIGFTIQVVDTTIRVIDLWKSANEVGEDVVVINARLDMIRARLKSWALDWGFKENKHLENRRFREYGFLAVRYLLIIQHRLTAIKNFEKKFPSLFKRAELPQEQGSAQRVVQLSEIAQADAPGLLELKELQTEVAAINHANIIQRWRWARREGKGLQMVDQVATLVKELQDFFVPPAVDPLAPVVFSQQLLSAPNVAVSRAAHDSFVGDRAAEMVGSIASFKAAASEMANHTETLRNRELMRSHRGISLQESVITAGGSRGMRSLAMFRSHDIPSTRVLIEWRTVPNTLPSIVKDGLHDQIHDLGLLLHSVNKPKEFRTLDCIAVVDMPVAPQEDARYGLIFKLDEKKQVFTLFDLLTNGNFATESLSDVLKLVQTLSKALLFLHLGGWLHKGIRSDNVLFFADVISNVNLCEPYIGGFEYSRSFEVKRLTQNVGDDKFENLYRHPDHQGLPLKQSDSADVKAERRQAFSYEADLYSFGVLMMEISFWSTASQIVERSVPDHADKVGCFREVFLDTIPGIKVRMGDVFSEATSLCLKSGFCTGGTGQPETIQEAFYLSVVRVLERCFL